MYRPSPSLVSVIALALAAAVPGTALAQAVVGSGVAPSEIGNSAERPLAFAASAPAEAALVIVVPSAVLPEDLPLSAGEREALERAIAAAAFAGKPGDTLSLRGIARTRRRGA